MVPAEAEIVLEGHVLLDEHADEGPYGDHTGYYNSVERFPVFQVSAVTMRRDPIYLTTFTGRPPDEPSVLGEALNEVFIPLLRQQFPEIVDFWLPPEGCSYRIAVVSMKKAYPGHAKRVMLGVWSYLRQFMYTKWVIVVDDDIDARSWPDVMWADLHPHGPGARHHRHREHADRLPRLRLAGVGPGLEDRPRRHQQVAARDPARVGHARSAWTRRWSTRSPRSGRASACPATAADLALSLPARAATPPCRIGRWGADMRDLTQGSITRHLLGMAAFIAVGLVVQTLYFLVDLYFVARLGKAGGGRGQRRRARWILGMAASQLIAVGALSLVARALGRPGRRGRPAGVQPGHGPRRCVFGVAPWCSATPLGPPALDALARRRGDRRAPAAPTCSPSCRAGADVPDGGDELGLRAAGVVGQPMAIQSARLVLNAVLAPVLIAGWGTGAPLGVAGAGLASTIAAAAALVVLVVLFPRMQTLLRLGRRS